MPGPPPATGTGGFNYVVLVPASDTILNEDDWVLCLGGRRFGKKALSMGLLRGARIDHVQAEYDSGREYSMAENPLKEMPPSIGTANGELNGMGIVHVSEGLDITLPREPTEPTEASEPEVHHIGRPPEAPPEPCAAEDECHMWGLLQEQEPERSEF